MRLPESKIFDELGERRVGPRIYDLEYRSFRKVGPNLLLRVRLVEY